MSMNYSGSLPEGTIELFERTLLNYRQKERDKELARNLGTIRTVGPTVQVDTVTSWEKTGGNATILASIKAKGVAADLISAKSDTKSHQMYKLTMGFQYNVRDINLDPTIYTRDVEIATREIRRLEDYLWVNGSTSPLLTGLVTAARANPRGKVDAYGASSVSPNMDSIGNWAGKDTYIDIYKDVLQAWGRIGDNFEAKFLVGRKIDLLPIRQMDDMRNVYADQIMDLFGATNVNQFLRSSEYVPSGYVYVVGRDMEGQEFVISEDLRVKAYAEQPGEVIPVELIEYVNPCEWHDNSIAAEINTA